MKEQVLEPYCRRVNSSSQATLEASLASTFLHEDRQRLALELLREPSMDSKCCF